MLNKISSELFIWGVNQITAALLAVAHPGYVGRRVGRESAYDNYKTYLEAISDHTEKKAAKEYTKNSGSQILE